ncbi:complement C1q subcomponent subunit B-like [Mizuhopecten yessoensis]|uniref:Complement C1q-like protein 4 n=1 Tax=Mizuhopecten yessoensis TaxID=6573 RepID=A0A210PIZ3_MIZYE|nr:complement C1q subcomponent subunit B-like [Mizuhopecten yessoensis]OWF36461.1 Complement C1q-like protein 4 [Mizuhopecten yessoensis]
MSPHGQRERYLGVVFLSLTLLTQCQGLTTVDPGSRNNDVTTLIRIVSELTDRVQVLETARTNVQVEIDNLEDKTENLQRQLGKCKMEQNPLDEDFTPIPNIAGDKGNGANETKTNTKRTPDALTKVRGAQEMTGRERISGEKTDRVGILEGMVAFYARLTSNVNNVMVDYTIKFGTVVTNRGGGYNPTTGAFTCPQPGMYVFSWTTALGSTGMVETEITRNGISSGTGVIKSMHESGAKDTNMVLLELSLGDVVLIRVWYISSPSAITLWDHRTYFSGFLLR